jgi:hypothetical protein
MDNHQQNIIRERKVLKQMHNSKPQLVQILLVAIQKHNNVRVHQVGYTESRLNFRCYITDKKMIISFRSHNNLCVRAKNPV